MIYKSIRKAIESSNSGVRNYKSIKKILVIVLDAGTVAGNSMSDSLLHFLEVF